MSSSVFLYLNDYHKKMLKDQYEGLKTIEQITMDSASVETNMLKLCKVRSVQFGQKGIPYLNTYDGRTIRYPDPLIKANDTIKIDLETNKIMDFIKTPFPPPPRCAHARAPPPLPATVPSSFLRRRRSPAVPSATVSFASTSATRDTPQFLLSLPNFLCPRSPAVLRAAAVVRHHRPGPSSRLRRHREVPGVRLENPFSTSPTLRACQSAGAITCRRPEPVSPSTSEPRRALCHGDLRLDVRNPGHAPISPLPP
uniref:Small ribosomal subunit protein eS4 central region domain-containing protein n=1 Tax=Zea mays TaxID=4577 RepID=A0A804PI56_MAIZE